MQTGRPGASKAAPKWWVDGELVVSWVVVLALVATLVVMLIRDADSSALLAVVSVLGTLGGHALGQAGKRRAQIDSDQRHACALERVIIEGKENGLESMLVHAQAALANVSPTD